MVNEKTDPGGVGNEQFSSTSTFLSDKGCGFSNTIMGVPNLPKPLTLEEKKYLLSVERGDLANVRRMLQRAHRKHHININCVDSLGRGALTLAIDGENLEMVELLIIMGVETRDALLQAINAEFVEAVELLLEHEELIHKEGQPYSWQKVDINTAMFTPDITPLILAAHRNNYEILKILLDRGATLPMPHDIRCGCKDCIDETQQYSLRHSLSRVNEYKALASPSLIALTSADPLLTAFQLSWELRTLSFAEPESKADYQELRKQCQKFAVDLLDQSRSSQELAIILNHDPDSPPYQEGDQMKLARLELAINYKQKQFVAHPTIQQLLAALWYDGVPGFRRKSLMEKISITLRVALMFPIYCIMYMIAPYSRVGKLILQPFMKFLVHASSYIFFLLILILVSQRAEVHLIDLFGTVEMKQRLENEMKRQRGNGPSGLEIIIVIYILGFVFEEIQEIYSQTIRNYLRNMWNLIDFVRNLLYLLVIMLRIIAYIQQHREIKLNPETAFIPREDWDAFDPQLIAEGLFAAANVFSALRLVYMFSINPDLGPLQISLDRMILDIVKFFFFYMLFLFAFACGLNQLLWYFADLERKQCDQDADADACMKWRRFGNLFESSQSLFWASFGVVGLENFDLQGIKSYTRFWGLLMFGTYSIINIIVLLNLLIAMMSNSFARIDQQSDTEWKFARAKLWMSYFEDYNTLPPPFNILPTIKCLTNCFRLRKKGQRRDSSVRRKEEKERDNQYTNVMRSLVWRYVSAMNRKAEESIVTEDDINEVKSEISAMRYEMLEIFERNGLDISTIEKKGRAVLAKRMKTWERRLMRDFQVAPVPSEEELQMDDAMSKESSLAKFKRIAKQVAQNTTTHKWGEVIRDVITNSQIGRCKTKDGNQQHLQKAMEQAKRLVMISPMPSGNVTPVDIDDPTSKSLLKIIKDFTKETEQMDINNLLTSTTDHSSSPTSIATNKTSQSDVSPRLSNIVMSAREKFMKSNSSPQLLTPIRPLNKVNQSNQYRMALGRTIPPRIRVTHTESNFDIHQDCSSDEEVSSCENNGPQEESEKKVFGLSGVVKRKRFADTKGLRSSEPLLVDNNKTTSIKNDSVTVNIEPENANHDALKQHDIILTPSQLLGTVTEGVETATHLGKQMRPYRKIDDVETLVHPKTGWI